MSPRSAVLASFVLVTTAASTFAQDTPRVGLTIQYPSAVGIVWNISDRFGVRPEFSFSTSAADPQTSSTGIISSSSSSHTIGIGVTGLIYVWKRDALRTYVAPRFAYARLSGTSEITSMTFSFPGLTPIPTTTVTETTATTKSGSGAFGAEYVMHRHFGVFADAGVNYSKATTSSRATPPPPVSSAISASQGSHGWSSRASAGFVLYF